MQLITLLGVKYRYFQLKEEIVTKPMLAVTLKERRCTNLFQSTGLGRYDVELSRFRATTRDQKSG